MVGNNSILGSCFLDGNRNNNFRSTHEVSFQSFLVGLDLINDTNVQPLTNKTTDSSINEHTNDTPTNDLLGKSLSFFTSHVVSVNGFHSPHSMVTFLMVLIMVHRISSFFIFIFFIFFLFWFLIWVNIFWSEF